VSPGKPLFATRRSVPDREAGHAATRFAIYGCRMAASITLALIATWLVTGTWVVIGAFRRDGRP
jgi:hypothetical protein